MTAPAERDTDSPARGTRKLGAVILRVADDLFAESGFAGTSVRQIAAAAECLPGALYHHFNGKIAIVATLLAEVIKRHADRCSARVAAGPGSDAPLRGLMRVMFDTVAEHRGAHRVLTTEAPDLDEQALDVLAAAEARLQRLWVGEIRAGQRRGALRDDLDPTVMWSMIRAQVYSAWRDPLDATALSARYHAVLMGGLGQPLSTATDASGRYRPPSDTRRGELLRTAAVAFAGAGYAGASMRDIADRAGIASPSLYSHFESKRALYDEVVAGLHARLEASTAAVVEQHGSRAPAELVAHLLGMLDTYAIEEPAGLVVAVAALHEGSDRPGDLAGLEVFTCLHAGLTAGIERGVFPGDVDVDGVLAVVRSGALTSLAVGPRVRGRIGSTVLRGLGAGDGER